MLNKMQNQETYLVAIKFTEKVINEYVMARSTVEAIKLCRRIYPSGSIVKTEIM